MTVRFTLCAAAMLVVALLSPSTAFAGETWDRVLTAAGVSTNDQADHNSAMAEELRRELRGAVAALQADIDKLKEQPPAVVPRQPVKDGEIVIQKVFATCPELNEALKASGEASEVHDLYWCQAELEKGEGVIKPFLDQLEEVCRLPKSERSIVCDHDIVGLERDVNDLKAKRFWIAAGIGFNAEVLPGSGMQLDPAGMVLLSYETQTFGLGAYGFLARDFPIDTFGGGGGITGFRFLDDNQVVGLGAFAGGSVMQYDIQQTGAWQQQLAAVEFGATLILTPVRGTEGDVVGKAMVLLQAGLKAPATHTFAPALSGTVNGNSYGATSGFIRLHVGGGLGI